MMERIVAVTMSAFYLHQRLFIVRKITSSSAKKTTAARTR
jgi:hypothetical protein